MLIIVKHSFVNYNRSDVHGCRTYRNIKRFTTDVELQYSFHSHK